MLVASRTVPIALEGVTARSSLTGRITGRAAGSVGLPTIVVKASATNQSASSPVDLFAMGAEFEDEALSQAPAVGVSVMPASVPDEAQTTPSIVGDCLPGGSTVPESPSGQVNAKVGHEGGKGMDSVAFSFDAVASPVVASPIVCAGELPVSGPVSSVEAAGATSGSVMTSAALSCSASAIACVEPEVSIVDGKGLVKMSTVLDPILMSKLHCSAECSHLIRGVLKRWGVSLRVIYSLLQRPLDTQPFSERGPRSALDHQARGAATTIRGCCSDSSFVKFADQDVLTGLIALYDLLFVSYPRQIGDSWLLSEALPLRKIKKLQESIQPTIATSLCVSGEALTAERVTDCSSRGTAADNFINDSMSTGESSTSEDTLYVAGESIETDDDWRPSGGEGVLLSSEDEMNMRSRRVIPGVYNGGGLRVLRPAKQQRSVLLQAESPVTRENWDTDSADHQSCLALIVSPSAKSVEEPTPGCSNGSEAATVIPAIVVQPTRGELGHDGSNMISEKGEYIWC